mgnify:CR=1 FL=1
MVEQAEGQKNYWIISHLTFFSCDLEIGIKFEVRLSEQM